MTYFWSMEIVFEREKHIYKSEAFDEIIKDTIRFFNGTPVHKLPPPVKFEGTGVYAIYYTGKLKYYSEIYQKNRLEFHQPIYVGKAVPTGWRQARDVQEGFSSHELFGRLREHGKSIDAVRNLNVEDFSCRFMILEGSASHLIGTVEAALIKYYKPIWNTKIDGFGNHDPGSGRYNQAKSDWDVIHTGRGWADKCVGKSATLAVVEKKIKEYFEKKKDVE
jgi:Eco29kI restriction endonuclease